MMKEITLRCGKKELAIRLWIVTILPHPVRFLDTNRL